MSAKHSIPAVQNSEVDIEYHKLGEDQLWKVDMLKEIVDALNDKITIDGITRDELNEVLEYLCTD